MTTTYRSPAQRQQARIDAKVARLAALNFCAQDGFSWPCPTERAIAEALGET